MSDAIWTELNTVFQDVMDTPGIVLNANTTAEQVPEWDSITHVLLVTAVEKKFAVKFTAGEIQSLQNVGDLVSMIQRKRK